jgi:hypothetical protein
MHRYTASLSHRCVPVVRLIRWELVDHYLSPCYLRAPDKLCSVNIIGNCPHLERWSVLQGSTIPEG